jgi:hypothetical protein
MTAPQIRLSGADRVELAKRIKEDINAFCVVHYPNDHRSHLGASEIGERCARKLWYVFRWMHREQFFGDDRKMLRLFNRGHQTEDRFATWIRGIGCDLATYDHNDEQFHIDGAQKHFGGSLDGKMKLPKSYDLPIEFLTEFKTHNERNFKKLIKSGVVATKPMHVQQMNTYGAHEMYNFDYAIYFALNKNDDDLYVEVVALDHSIGKDNVKKAEAIIFSTVAPPKIAGSAAYSECVYCPMKGICHNGAPVDVNCRSCINSKPIDDGQWYCEKWQAVIPKTEIPKACPQWMELPHR